MLYPLLLFYISMYYIRPFDWMKAFQGTQVFLWLGCISTLVLLIAWITGKISLFCHKTDVMVGGFVVAIAMSHIRHVYFGGAINSCRIFFPTLVGYLLTIHALNSGKKIRWFIMLLIGLTLFLSYQSCLQFAHGTAAGGLTPLIENQRIMRVRWYGPFHDPNDLGLALVLPIPFLIHYLLNKKYLLATISLPPILFAIYLTNSRGTILSLFASAGAYLILRFRSFKKGGLLGLLLLVLIIGFGPSRADQISASGASAHGRLDAWYAGLHMFMANPLFGVGQGMFTDYNSLTAHNSFVLVLAELGAFGSFFFSGLFYYPIAWSKRNLWCLTTTSEEEERRLFKAAGFSSLVGIMVAIFFLSRSYILLPFMVVAILIASINHLAKSTSTHLPDLTAENFHLIPIGTFVAIQIVGIDILVKLFI